MARGGWVYIMTNKPGGILYIGVTTDIVAGIHQHRDGNGSKFCKRYNLTSLVYVEEASTILEAIAREKAMKAWKREWKIELIEGFNPEWRDLTGEMIG